jgi:hypothetical protein
MPDKPQTAYSRRKMLGGLVVGVAAANVGSQSVDAPTIAATNQDSPSLPSIEVIALNRMAFGIGPGSLEAFRILPGASSREKFKAYVEQQLEPNRIEDQACEARLKQLQSLSKSIEQLWRE